MGAGSEVRVIERFRPPVIPEGHLQKPCVCLEIGCGGRKYPGAIGLDRVAAPGVDLRVDLDGDWPVRSGTVDLLIATHVLEHLDLLPAMSRIHRCLRPGGLAWIRVPHASKRDFWKDPTHRRPFTTGTFDYWVPGNDPDYGFPEKFEIVFRRLNVYGNLEHHRFRPSFRWFATPLQKAIDGMANRSFFLCERFWAPFIGGFAEVEFVLRKL